MTEEQKAKQKFILDFLKRRGAQPQFLKYTWATMKDDQQNQNTYNALAGFKFLEGPGIFLHGNCGTGKSHIIKAIFMTMAEWKIDCMMINEKNRSNDLPPIDTSAYKVQWISMSEFIESQRGKPDHELRRHVYNASILFIDDFGVYELTDWAKDQVWMLIDHCYTRGVQLIITSNCDLEGVKQLYGERVSSRLREVCLVLPMIGEDKRIRKQQENFEVAIRRINQRKDIEG